MMQMVRGAITRHRPRGAFLVLLALFVCGGACAAPAAELDADPRGPAGDAQYLDYAQVNGVRLAYRIHGSGTPLVFVHGEGYSHEVWSEQIEAVGANHLFLSYDRRGHGSSEAPVTGYSVIAHAEDLHALLTHLGIREAHFVVHSRGGAIITQFIRLYPQCIRSVIFADATILLVDLSEVFSKSVQQRRSVVVTRHEALQRREAAKSSSFTRIAQSMPKVRPVLYRMVDQYSLRNSMHALHDDFTAPINVGPWNDREFPDMTRFGRPMLLIVGAQTDPFFINGARAARERWPNTRYQEIEATDHLLMLESPGKFNELLLEFVDAVDARAPDRLLAPAGLHR